MAVDAACSCSGPLASCTPPPPPATMGKQGPQPQSRPTTTRPHAARNSPHVTHTTVQPGPNLPTPSHIPRHPPYPTRVDPTPLTTLARNASRHRTHTPQHRTARTHAHKVTRASPASQTNSNGAHAPTQRPQRVNTGTTPHCPTDAPDQEQKQTPQPRARSPKHTKARGCSRCHTGQPGPRAAPALSGTRAHQPRAPGPAEGRPTPAIPSATRHKWHGRAHGHDGRHHPTSKARQQKPTAPGIPRRSPIQVLTRPDPA